MKKVFLLIIMILLLPLFVYAEDNDIILESIEFVKGSDYVEDLSNPTIENNKINLDVKLYEIGDYAEYKIKAKNPTNKDLYIEKNIVNTDSNYFDYEISGIDKTTVIDKNSEKGFILRVTYQNAVPKEDFFSAKYKDVSNVAFHFSDGINPETKRSILLLLVVSICVFIAFKYNKKSKLILLLLGFIPFTVVAATNYNLSINSNITVQRVKPNPCIFDGELVQGAEYTNGQYTYRYMQEGRTANEWQNIENDGWGVVLTDKNSEEDVTTKLCTSINDKPIVSMSSMFYNSKTKSIDLSSFDTSKVSNMQAMVYNCSNVDSLDLSSFDTSNVIYMNAMFGAIANLKSIDLHYFDTAKTTIMSAMFSGDVSLEEVNLDGFDLKSSTNGSSIIGGMFNGTNNLKKVSMKNWKLPESFVHAIGCRTSSLCSTALESIDVTGWDLKQTKNVEGLFGDSSTKKIKGLDTWDTSNITDMGNMFLGANRLEYLDLSSFDTSKVTNMTNMFSNDTLLEELNLDGFDLTASTNGSIIIGSMFRNTNNLKKVSMKNWKISEIFTDAIGCRVSSLCSENLESIDVTGWDLSKTTDLSAVFRDYKAKEIIGLNTWNTSTITNMVSMFNGANRLESLNLSRFDTSNVTNMNSMFSNCSSLTSLDLSGFDTSKVTDMLAMFYGDALLETLNLDGFNLTASTNGSGAISGIFSGTNSIKKVSMKNWKIPESFTHAIGCRMSSLCSTTLESIDVTGWDLRQVENVAGLFGNSTAKEIIGLDTWDTSNITNMDNMFGGANRLESLDLSHFDTSNVTNMYGMFSGTSLLKTIKVSDKFQTNQVTNSSFMFKDANSLVGGNGTVYDANHIDKDYARIDTFENPGYFTRTS